MPQNTDQPINLEGVSANRQPLVEESATAQNSLVDEKSSRVSEDKTISADDDREQTKTANANVTETLTDEDFPETFSDEEKETIKKVASDDNLSKAKSSASILVEQFINAKETFNRSLGS